MLAALAEVQHLEEDLAPVPTPQNYNEACTGLHAVQWREAIQREVDSLRSNGTWCLATPPIPRRLLTPKWVFKLKLKADGSIDRFKARLVVGGYRQQYGFDYFDTYSPVVRQTTFRMIVCLAAFHSMGLHHFDIDTAFLYDEV